MAQGLLVKPSGVSARFFFFFLMELRLLLKATAYYVTRHPLFHNHCTLNKLTHYAGCVTDTQHRHAQTASSRPGV